MNDRPLPSLSSPGPIPLLPLHQAPTERQHTELFSNKYETKRLGGDHLHHKGNLYLANKFTKRMATVTVLMCFLFVIITEVLLCIVHFNLSRYTVLLN